MVKNFQNRINQKSCTMSGIPSLKRSIAESKDETDKLLLKTIKYLTRLQADMATWNPEEARITRMQLIKILQTRSPTVKLDDIPTDDDDGIDIDTSNIVVGKRQKRRVVRYQDEQFADLFLADVPEDEIDAALEEDVSEDDDDEWVAEEDEDEEWVDEDEEVENNLGRNRGQFLAEEKENDC